MICARCKSPVPDNSLVCPGCVYDKSRSAMRRYQYHPLMELQAGRGSFETRTIHGGVHLKMFGCVETYCGLPVETGQRKGFIPLARIAGPGICANCVTTVEILAAEARIDAELARRVSP